MRLDELQRGDIVELDFGEPIFVVCLVDQGRGRIAVAHIHEGKAGASFYKDHLSHGDTRGWDGFKDRWKPRWPTIHALEKAVGDDQEWLVRLVNAGKVRDLGKEHLRWPQSTTWTRQSSSNTGKTP